MNQVVKFKCVKYIVMKLQYVVLLVSIIFLSGCAKQPATVPQTMPEYSISLVDYPSSVKVGEEFTVSWRVSSNTLTTISHTAVHYDTASHPGNFGIDVPPNAGYNSLAGNFISSNFSIADPETFSAKMKIDDPGKVYFRSHAIIDGKNYWTQEYMIDVLGTAPPSQGVLEGQVTSPPPLPSVKEYAIEADDSGFYMGTQQISSLSVAGGDEVKITFQVRQTGVYYGGLDFRGCQQSSGGTLPGSSTVIQFIASDTCTITSYWPSSGIAKSNLQVTVS